jgi:hypothetical protein
MSPEFLAIQDAINTLEAAKDRCYQDATLYHDIGGWTTLGELAVIPLMGAIDRMKRALRKHLVGR